MIAKLKENPKLIILFIIVLVIISIGISYAYWRYTVSQTNNNKLVSDCFKITLQNESSAINLEKAYPITDEEGKSLTPYTFTIKNNCESYAKYDVNLEVLNTTTMDSKYVKILLNDKESSILSSNEITEKTLEEATTSYKLTTGYLDKNAERTYDLRMWIDENVTASDPVSGKTIQAKITITASYLDREPTFCELNPETAACEILAKGETEELKFDNTVDNNLRYVGSDPNNYVSFNNELWRIIGVMNNIDDGTGEKETRLKLIRNESIGNYSWDNKLNGIGSSTDSYGSNDWSDSRLMMLLNPGYEALNSPIYEYEGSIYFNGKKGTCYNGSESSTTPCDFTEIGIQNDMYRNMVQNTVWKLGGIKSNSNIVSAFYNDERNSTVYTNRPTEWTGKIGLIYPSDYGFATAGGNNINRDTCLQINLGSWNEYADCYDNDWLYHENFYQWSITSVSTSNRIVYGIAGSGSVNTGYTNFVPGVVYPVIFLKFDLKFASGTGDINNPYTILLE